MSWCFLTTRLRPSILGRNATEAILSSFPWVTSGAIQCFTSQPVVMPALFIWQVSAYQVSKVTIEVIVFPSMIGQYFVERNSPNHTSVPYPLNLHLPSLASLDSHLSQPLLWWLSRFLISITPPADSGCHSKQGRPFPSSSSIHSFTSMDLWVLFFQRAVICYLF